MLETINIHYLPAAIYGLVDASEEIDQITDGHLPPAAPVSVNSLEYVLQYKHALDLNLLELQNWFLCLYPPVSSYASGARPGHPPSPGGYWTTEKCFTLSKN